MTKSTRFALFIILTLILCDCDETTQVNQNSSVKTYNVEGAYKVTTTEEQVNEAERVTTEKNVQQYNQRKFRVEKVNNLALEMQKNMSNGDISDFIQKQMAAKNANTEAAKKMEVYESNVDRFILHYKLTYAANLANQMGKANVTRKMKFTKDNREIFYDPQFMGALWAKAALLIERNELTQEHEAFLLLDKEFLKDDIVDFVTVIKKSTWFVFKYSRFMPFWLETISYITDAEFLAAASKEELIYLHYYTKKLFKIFTRVLVGNKTSRGQKLFFLIFAQVTQELSEYEFAVNLLFKHIRLDDKADKSEDFSELMVNQRKILETLKFIQENKYMEAIDPSLSDEMQKLDDMMTKMNKGIELSLGDIEVTTIIKTKVIDIKKKITKRISLILQGAILERFRKSRCFGHLHRILRSLQDLLNSHILDNDQNVEIILESMDLFLVKLEEYLSALQEKDNSYTAKMLSHSELMSSVAFFISKVETAHSFKTQETRKMYTYFLLRMQLFVLALEKPVKDQEVVLDFDDSDQTFDPSAGLSDNLDDLFGEFEELDKDPEVADKVADFRRNAERTLYIIEHNIDLTDRPVDGQLLKFFNQFKNEMQRLAGEKTMLQPFYMRMLEIFTETEKDLPILATLPFIKQLQDLYLKVKVIRQSQQDFEEEIDQEKSSLGRVVYGYKAYRESVHKQVPQILRHLTYVCSKCDPAVLARINNQMTSHKDSLMDAVTASNRLTMLSDSVEPRKGRIVFVVEVLDCENSNIFVKLIQKGRRRLI